MQLKLDQMKPPLVGDKDERVEVLLVADSLTRADYRAEFVGNRVQFEELDLTFFLVYRRPGLWLFVEERTGRTLMTGAMKEEALRKGTQRLNNMRLLGMARLMAAVAKQPSIKSYPDTAPSTKLGKDDEETDKPIPRIKFLAKK